MTSSGGPAAQPPPPVARPWAGRSRLRRRPLLLVVVAAAAVALLLLLVSSVRPTVASGGTLALADAHQGTAYAFDGVVCLGSGTLSATVRAVRVEQRGGTTTRLVQLPQGSPPTLGFPVADADGASLEGRRVPAGEQDCVTRLIVVPDRQGSVRPGRVRVTYAYGPGGLLRRTASLEPDVALQVTRTGPDPRLSPAA